MFVVSMGINCDKGGTGRSRGNGLLAESIKRALNKMGMCNQ